MLPRTAGVELPHDSLALKNALPSLTTLNQDPLSLIRVVRPPGGGQAIEVVVTVAGKQPLTVLRSGWESKIGRAGLSLPRKPLVSVQQVCNYPT